MVDNNEKTEELFSRYYETGDKKIRNEIVMLNMNIVKYAAVSTKNMYQKYAETEDIVNEATIALMAAVDTFSPDKNTKFATYATIRVRGAIIDYIRKQDVIPRNVRKFAKEYDKAYASLYSELGREPTIEEIAESMGVTPQKIDEALSRTASAQTFSFEEVVFENGYDIADDSYDTQSGWEPERRLISGEMETMLAKAIDKLKEKERLVITLYYYEKLKYSEIAEVIGVSESRVCQIHSSAVSHMRDMLKEYME